jgi:hypothetical protein
LPTVLVTVRGPDATIDLDMPGDIPVADLFPLLIEVSASRLAGYISGGPEQWGLGPIDSTPLPPTQTLIDAGIVDGSVLLFQDAGAWTQHLYAVPSAAASNQPVAQVDDTGGIGIRWNREGLLS